MALNRTNKADDNKENKDNKRARNPKKKRKTLKLILIIMSLIVFIVGGSLCGILYAIIKTVPPIDPSKVTAYLNENSVIVDQKGEVIEKILTQEFRTKVELNQISKYLKDAVIAIEDERFLEHHGVDFRSVGRAVFTNLKSMSFKQGFSTLTQQLAKNRYLSQEKTITRKVKEMYIAMQLERHLTKDQILRAYLNTSPFGQGAYGVEAAAQTYFSKSASELTLAESAMIAGATKSTVAYELYKVIKPENFDKTKHKVVGVDDPTEMHYIEILGNLYVPIYNPRAEERQRIILKKMLELGKINKVQYDNALKEDMRKAIKPDPKKNEEIETSYFNDYVKDSVVKDLMKKYDYSKADATDLLLTGGLKIYSTMDIGIQSKLEDAYDNFGKILTANSGTIRGAKLVSRTLDKQKNIIDSSKKIVFYAKDNLLDQDYNLKIEKGTFEILSDGNIAVKNNKLNYRNADVTDFYTIDEKQNLITHSAWSLDPKTCYTSDKENRRLIINKNFLDENKDFYSINSNGDMIIKSKYFYKDKKGIMQPQSSFVLLDYNGHIKALIGGRNVKGSKILNRALRPRQPGSSLKPISVYLPALDNGFTAASVVDDVPHYDNNGNIWPRNWYGRRNSSQRNNLSDDYRGLVTLRYSVEQSINVSTVKFLKKIGISTSMDYLSKMGIIDYDTPSNDSFTTKEEAVAKGSSNYDENLSALALGGMTRGVSPLKMTAAFGTIANDGVYTEPIAYTKVLDRDGNVILENKSTKNTVVSEQVAYLMTDILKSTVTGGIARRAQLHSYNTKIPVAGKTGTTQNRVDAWFVGYTPYYIAGTWIGNDNQSIKLDKGSQYATILWSHIMKDIHKNLPAKDFDPVGGLVTRTIDTTSGKLATELSRKDPRGNTVRTEKFIRGTEPKDYDDVHVEVAVDISTNKLASEFCPPELVENRVFIKRPTPYNPEENKNYIPRDYKYQVPTEVCDLHLTPPDPFDNNNGDNDEDNDNGDNNNGDNNNGDNNNGDNNNGDNNNLDENGNIIDSENNNGNKKPNKNGNGKKNKDNDNSNETNSNNSNNDNIVTSDDD
ncbi:transglycosylase domain-containing protein [Clostridiaceae bacterium M8S5]|nr:transglycosylase domain-containing protein [Clostridiaceae bacterium M8S5]